MPSAFEMGLCDCRWIYRLGKRTIIVTARVSSEAPALQWRVSVEGGKCRFLVFGHLALGEHEYASRGRMEIDRRKKQFVFRFDPDSLWGQRYPRASYRLVTSTPKAGRGDRRRRAALSRRQRRGGGYAAIRTRPTQRVRLRGRRLADRRGPSGSAGGHSTPQASTTTSWRPNRRASGGGSRAAFACENAKGEATAIDTILPWLVHDAMIHLTAPHGLEQYSVAAWGTRDVCQGPLELLLALEHDGPAKAILRVVFAQQYENAGDWPQWFMLEPYSAIQDREAHGDIIVWPLKALCDYIEAPATSPSSTSRSSGAATTISRRPPTPIRSPPISSNWSRRVRERLIPGTHLVRYGNGDWNDLLQPVDPALRDWMTSSWTVGLLTSNCAAMPKILRATGRSAAAKEHDALAAAMKKDFTRCLVRDGVVAGYAVFNPAGGRPSCSSTPATRTPAYPSR